MVIWEGRCVCVYISRCMGVYIYLCGVRLIDTGGCE